MTLLREIHLCDHPYPYSDMKLWLALSYMKRFGLGRASPLASSLMCAISTDAKVARDGVVRRVEVGLGSLLPDVSQERLAVPAVEDSVVARFSARVVAQILRDDAAAAEPCGRRLAQLALPRGAEQR